MRVDNPTRFRAEQLFEVLLDGEEIEEISAGLKIAAGTARATDIRFTFATAGVS
jgi:hypothetical protein